ncbi:uncharacterized protein LOC108327996 isoform X2 [Vigna angularis]|uniref:uncharacterized protein LOC108327996 isoform X2 n=1 Tax=Phaseolus angularis TaxID=3914 RepID=UPI000809D111|nr:uncharacterized protein LOC108327996 isoform X2 [Vigna angularis]
MKALRKENEIVVCGMPKEGIKSATNTESTVLDEANSGRQVSRRVRKFSVSTRNKRKRRKTLRISLVGPSTVSLKKKLIVLDLNGLLVDIVSPPPKDRKADATVGSKALFKRPFYLDFLNFCFEKFEVAIWSSRTRKRIDYVINYLMGNMKQRLLFCWPCNSVFPHTFSFQNQSDNSLAAGGDLREYLDGLANAENIQKYVEQHPFGQSAIDERSQSWNFYSKVLDSLSTCQPEK